MPESNFDPFAELQLAPDAEPELIKAAFKALAKKYHPDRFSDPEQKAQAEEKMARINEAQRLLQSGQYQPSPPSTPVAPEPQQTVPIDSYQSQPISKPARQASPQPVSILAVLVAGIVFACLLAIPSLLPGDHLKKALDHEEKGEYKLSLEQLNKAVSKDPHNRELYGHRARIWEKLGQPQRAAVDLKNAETPVLTLPAEVAESTPSPSPTGTPSPIP